LVSVAARAATVSKLSKLSKLSKHSAWWTARTYGRLTSRARVLPELLIAGGQRCGSTSMFKTLGQHPAVVPPFLRKGVHYFDVGYTDDIDDYRGNFPLRATMQRVSRRAGVPALTYESSPYYLYHPLAAERIARDLPGVKLIVLVRDPVERAYSAHAHEIARGFETETFERAIDLEGERLAGEAERLVDPGYRSMSHQHHAYLHRGQYVDELQRLEKLFGRQRIHVVDSNAFFTEPESQFSPVLDFLGLPAVANVRFERHNARRRVPLPDHLRQRLERYFEPYDQALAAWLGQTPSWRQ
jgi:hypothetical protein